jgi:uncharacterized protein
MNVRLMIGRSTEDHNCFGQELMEHNFWDLIHNKCLVRPVCASGHSFFPPQQFCPNCGSFTWSLEPTSGLGEVYSYTVVHRSPFPDRDVPYVIAIVDLDEGWSMLANVVGIPHSQVHIGLRVAAAWRKTDDGSWLPVFEARR